MYVLMSTFELSLDSIWFVCFSESALHQYYMPTLAEEGFFLLGNDNHRKHKHTGHKQQKSKLFPHVEIEERLMWRKSFAVTVHFECERMTQKKAQQKEKWR